MSYPACAVGLVNIYKPARKAYQINIFFIRAIHLKYSNLGKKKKKRKEKKKEKKKKSNFQSNLQLKVFFVKFIHKTECHFVFFICSNSQYQRNNYEMLSRNPSLLE